MSDLTEIIQGQAEHIAELEAALTASQAREESYRADVVRITATIDALRANANEADLNLATAMRKAEVLAAEVRAWHDADTWHELLEYMDTCTDHSHRFAVETAMAATDAAGALNP